MATTEETSLPPTELDLPWDKNSDFARRLLRLPDGSILAYGGGDDQSVIIRLPSLSSAPPSSVTSTGSPQGAQVTRRWEDDAVRAVAVSPDGRRVAVGLDTGSTHIYVYDEYNKNDGSGGECHPFAQAPRPDESSFEGPCMDGCIRDLQFHPNCSGPDSGDSDEYGYPLVVASEAGLTVVDVSTDESAAATAANKDWSDRTAEHHDGSGIRSLTFGKIDNDSKTVLSSLAMNGRHCLWDVTVAKQPADWTLLHRDKTSCITKKDLGEVLGADVMDRSCRLAFCKDLVVLPGEPFLQFRMWQRNEQKLEECCDTSNGHLEGIVVVADGPGKHVVTSGRDGRVVLWRCENADQVGCFFCFGLLSTRYQYTHKSCLFPLCIETPSRRNGQDAS